MPGETVMIATDIEKPRNDSFWLTVISILSVVVSAAVAFLILGPRPEGTSAMLDVSGLPAVNALLNSVTTMLLLLGLTFSGGALASF